MNLASLDLNLLTVLDALLAEASVSRAAGRIGLSQPAASHALRRLREILNDPLLVRTGSRMELTPRAVALRAPLREAMDRLRDLFVLDDFDPATTTRRFVLMMPDHVLDLLVPPLVERAAGTAPGARLEILPWRGPSSMTAELARGVDLVIACTADAYGGFHRQRLFADTEALAVRKGHPIGARLTRLEAFLDARHVAVVGRGAREDPIDRWLREFGHERPIALIVPSYLQALHVAVTSDLVAFVPQRLIETAAAHLPLRAIAPPIDPGPYEEFLFHPTRLQVDPGAIWLRKHVIEIGRALNRKSLARAA